MIGERVFTVTAHYTGGGERTFADLPRTEALRRMRGALKYDKGATFTVAGPHPAPTRLAGVWN